MNKLHFLREVSKEEMEQISELRFSAPTRTLQIRSMIIYALVNSGLQNKQIAANIGIQEDTVTDTVKGFNKDGLLYLTENKYAPNKHNLDPYYEIIKKSFNEKPPCDLEEAIIRVKELTVVVNWVGW